MKIIYGFAIFTFLTLKVFGQQVQPGDANYNPIKVKLLSLQHKANSNTLKNQKTDLDAFQLNQLNESVNIYVIYEIDMKYVRDRESDNYPPKKVMDLDFMYSYKYLIPCSSTEEINKLLPVIELGKGQTPERVKVSRVSLSKGKLKSAKIKSSAITIDTTSQQLTLTLDKTVFQKNTILEIEIETKTPYFNALLPSFNANGDFARTLTISVPPILKYQLPKDSLIFELQSEEKNTFVFLHLNRRIRDWNKIVEEYWTECVTYTYKVNGIKPLLSNIAFELDGIELPLNIDIGVPLRDLYLNER